MAENIGLTAFVVCYGIVFLLELYRYFRKTRLSRWLLLIFTVTGLAIQGFYLEKYYLFQQNRIITNAGGWFYILVFGLVLLYLYLSIYHGKVPFGLFMLPLVFLLVALAASVRGIDFPEQQTGRFIRAFHAVSLVLATCGVLIGFVTGGMYLLQRKRLKSGKPLLRGIVLPSLESLEYANRRSVKLSVVFLGLGILSGFYINYLVGLEPSVVRPHLLDPMIAGAIVLFCFMGGFLALTSFTDLFQSGQSTALLTIVCFLFLLSILLMGALCRGSHWQQPVKTVSPRVATLDRQREA